MIKDFIDIREFSAAQLSGLLDRAIADKKLFSQGRLPATLDRKTLAMIFEKPSLRTRVSFESAMTQLGGHAIYLSQSDIGLGSREAVQDIARTLSRMCNGIMARTFRHDLVEQLARHAAVPVINGLTDFSHPCQAMADLMTVRELLGDLKGKTIVFVGDGNNVARSLAGACLMLGARFILACPSGYELNDAFMEKLMAGNPHADCATSHNPCEAVAGADVIYTDTWVSMGQEDQRQKRINDFEDFQINSDLMAKAPKNAIVLHCLPAYRGFEISEEVFEAHAEAIFRQAENRLHFQRTLLAVLIGEGGIK
ncbi:MAG: ornithine carbamoyltransferase [Planctomycetes bacterium]|nr:ornithine carbamoyltransferase [Planctomycetota bacterium]